MAVFALKRKRYDLGAMLPFLVLHASVLLVLTVPFKVSMIAWLAGSYYLRMFGVTGGYHRYFSHRSYKLNRFWQFCLAFLAQTSGQKGALWWAAHHRDHHLYSDRKEDLHSPVHEGFWWSHLGWILSDEYDDYDPKRIADFGEVPGAAVARQVPPRPADPLRRGHLLASAAMPAFVWGFFVATVVLYHGTFLINSLAHIWGTRRFADAGREPQQLLARARDHGRGLAQQPPLLHVERAPGHPLVGGRHHVLPAQGALVGRHRPRPAPVSLPPKPRTNIRREPRARLGRPVDARTDRPPVGGSPTPVRPGADRGTCSAHRAMSATGSATARGCSWRAVRHTIRLQILIVARGNAARCTCGFSAASAPQWLRCRARMPASSLA